ncbi:MAG: CHAT domain-containing protein [Acidobacteriia bacterium]|nr:CHAT domain-containing protein [Terriglobia bacterium]
MISAVRLEEFAVALDLTERFKTRNLGDHLLRQEVKPKCVSDQDWALYQGYLAEVREKERAADGSPSSEGAVRERGAVRSLEDLDALRGLRARVTELERRFGGLDPDYVPFAPPLGMEEIAKLPRVLDAVLVEFRVTSEGTYVFLVGPGERELCRDQMVEVPELTAAKLRELLFEWPVAGVTVTWIGQGEQPEDMALWFSKLLKTCYEHGGNPPLWQDDQDQACGRLYDVALTKVHQRLRERYPGTRRLILIPSQGLHLLPLHACCWADEGGVRRYLLDDLEAMLGAKRKELSKVRMSAVDAVNAQFRLRGMPEKPFANPYYWAAFQCIGAGWRPRK